MRVIKLCKGAGNGIDRACLMTAVAMVNGEADAGDRPSCVCPVIRAFVIKSNDMLSDEHRARYYSPLIWELPGTASTAAVRLARARVAAKYANQFAAAADAAATAADAAATAAARANAANAYADDIAALCVECIREMIAVDPPPKERTYAVGQEQLAAALGEM